MSFYPDSPVTVLRSVGPARAALLKRLHITTIGGLIGHFPREHQDRSVITPIGRLEPGTNATVAADIAARPEVRIHHKTTVITAMASDSTGTLDLVWFNQPYLQSSLKPGKYILSGPVSRFRGRAAMERPEYEAANGKEQLSGARIVPVYPLTEGVSQKMMRGWLKEALDGLVPFSEVLPEAVIAENGLEPRDRAVRNIHYPESAEAFRAARRTLVFTELYTLQTRLFAARGTVKRGEGIVFADTGTDRFLGLLPFRLTAAQERVLREILEDTRSGSVMNRLIQGDVGSGKTAVAMAAMHAAAANGCQAALMAPTETLARQHYDYMKPVFAALGMDTVLLTGSIPKAEKDGAKARLKSGEAAVAVGTHALLTENVVFKRLGLCVCDEQHRFGVRQRGALNGKGASPHVIVMTATPIPRTLALILYGDLDISVIDGLPPGRTPVKTNAVGSAYRDRIFAFIKKQAEAGRQAYIVCPVIEENENGLESVAEYADAFARASGITPVALHGKMSQNDKNAAMESFASGAAPVLVATTVIEVGINVPNATVMLIENAERFGLSQLHQLRGRVGRGGHQSYCILVTDAVSDVTRERLRAMTGTNDGFELAELDLRLRGPGDFFGTKQHGLPELRVANLYRDGDILKEAQVAARKHWDGSASDESLESAVL